MKVTSVSSHDLAAALASGAAIPVLDVSTPVEFQEMHLAASVNVPLDQLHPRVALERLPDDCGTVYVVCRTGMRSRRACEEFLKAGYSHVVSVSGGLQACREAGVSLVHGRKALSVERQVRLVVGSGVVTGVVAGWLLHPALAVISCCMGAGLIFAGITDSCPLALFLAALPWNRTRASGASSQGGSYCLTAPSEGHSAKKG